MLLGLTEEIATLRRKYEDGKDNAAALTEQIKALQSGSLVADAQVFEHKQEFEQAQVDQIWLLFSFCHIM